VPATRESTIALCMIVRDEEARIGQCIESVQDLIDELVVVDTGSRDRTVEIAESHGAKVLRHSWHGDFSAARNAGLELARSDWILVLDADEIVAKEDHSALRAMASTGEKVAYRFVTRNYGYDSRLAGWVSCRADDPYARGFTGWHPSVKVRMFPNGSGIRFSGRVHELVHDSIERLGIPRRTSDVPIHHYGRGLAGLSERKQLQYLELGRKKTVDNPTDPKAYFELGNVLAEMGRFDQAAVEYQTSIRLSGGSPAALAALGSVRYYQGCYADAADLYRQSLNSDPNQPETRRNLATSLISLGDYAAARRELAELIAEYSNLHNVFYLNGIATYRQGEFNTAVELFAQELQCRPGNRPAAEMLADISADTEHRTKIIEIGQILVDKYPAEAHLMNLCGEVYHHDGQVDKAASYFEQAVDADASYARAWNNLGVAQLARDRLHDALSAFRNALRLDPHNTMLHNNIRALQKKI